MDQVINSSDNSSLGKDEEKIKQEECETKENSELNNEALNIKKENDDFENQVE